jgi:predicted lipoprotein with Yx(FWY)xxD motif
MYRSGRTYRAAAVAVAMVAVLVSACASQTGGGAAQAPSQASAASQAPAATAVASTSGAAGSAYTVEVAHDAKLGDHLTGKDGKSLYVLTKDTPGTSTCVDSCAATWPPFTLDSGETVVAGMDVTGTLGTLKRADGSMQVTYDNLPVYYFSGDSAAGDAKGQGIGGVWYVVTPAGAPGGSGAPAPNDGGYSY